MVIILISPLLFPSEKKLFTWTWNRADSVVEAESLDNTHPSKVNPNKNYKKICLGRSDIKIYHLSGGHACKKESGLYFLFLLPPCAPCFSLKFTRICFVFLISYYFYSSSTVVILTFSRWRRDNR